jgi:beta-galactosidase
MTRTPFNDGWGCREPLGPFAVAQGAGGNLTQVTLPLDALRDTERRADAPSKGAGAYYPGGAFTYVKTFNVPTAWTDQLVSLEFQGAYRHAMVFVNNEFAGKSRRRLCPLFR